MDAKMGQRRLDSPETEPLSSLTGAGVPGPHMPRVALYVEHPEAPEAVPLLPGVPVVIGRAAPSTLRIQASTLSREHARFLLTDGRVAVEDLGSKNGTYLSGARVQRAELDI